MFLGTCVCVTLPYSSRANAERAVAMRLWRLEGVMNQTEYRNQFIDACNREDYGSAINVWNDWVRMYMLNDSRWLAAITENELDQPFP